MFWLIFQVKSIWPPLKGKNTEEDCNEYWTKYLTRYSKSAIQKNQIRCFDQFLKSSQFCPPSENEIWISRSKIDTERNSSTIFTISEAKTLFFDTSFDFLKCVIVNIEISRVWNFDWGRGEDEIGSNWKFNAVLKISGPEKNNLIPFC